MSQLYFIKIDFIFPWIQCNRLKKFVVFKNGDQYILKYLLDRQKGYGITVMDTNLYDLKMKFIQIIKKITRTKMKYLTKIEYRQFKKDFSYGPHFLIWEIILRISILIRLALLPIEIATTFSK